MGYFSPLEISLIGFLCGGIIAAYVLPWNSRAQQGDGQIAGEPRRRTHDTLQNEMGNDC